MISDWIKKYADADAHTHAHAVADANADEAVKSLLQQHCKGK